MTVCSDCNNEFSKVGVHWSRSSECDYPNLSDNQVEVVTGLLMGDGSVIKQSKNARLQAEMISEKYLNYLDKDIFPVIGNGVKLKHTAYESSERAKLSGFSKNATEENYSATYQWRTMNHPALNGFREWYKTGQKVWPDGIELTPTVLKHWYCSDGQYNNGQTCDRIVISMSNEVDNVDKIDSMIESAGFSVSNWLVDKRSENHWRCEAQFSKDESHKMFEYMGSPLPGFEYKWPNTEN